MQFDSSKKDALYGVGYINAKVSWLWMAAKNTYPFSMSKVVLNVKVKFLLISWHFLVVFWWGLLTPTHPFIETFIYVILKVFRRYISDPSVIYVWFVVLQFWNFKCFQQKVKFLGCFWAVFWTWPTKMWSNLFETLTSDAMYHNSVGLWWSFLYS